MQQPTGSIVISYLSPPIPMKLALWIWTNEFIDLNALLSFQLGAPEPTLADALQVQGNQADLND